MNIRGAREDELPLLQDIEDAAGEAFRDIGMPEIADDPAPSIDTLLHYQRAGRAWVAVDDTDQPIAYLIAEPVDGALYIEQVSVHPSAARQRIGRSLIDHAAAVAAGQGLTGLTLCTFVDVPWNAPYYERCGFRQLSEPEVTPGLRAIRQREADHGFDRWPRTCMTRPLLP